MAAAALVFGTLGGFLSMALRPDGRGGDTRETAAAEERTGTAPGEPAPTPTSPAPAEVVAAAPPPTERAAPAGPSPQPVQPATRQPTRPAATQPRETRAERPSPAPAREDPAPAAAERAAETPARAQPAPAERTPPVTAPTPAPTAAAPAANAGVSGVVRDARTGTPLSGARVTILGTELQVTTGPGGAYAIPDAPDGRLIVVATANGYSPQGGVVLLDPGGKETLDLGMPGPVSASSADEEVAEGRWEAIDAATAEELLGQPPAVIGGLWIEGITRTSGGGRPRVRVAQLTEAGDRVTLVQTRAGGVTRATGVPQLSAVRIMPPSDAYPMATGTGSFAGVLVTASATLAPDALRAMLGRLIPLPK